MARDSFALRRTATVLGSAAAIVVVVAVIAVVGIHRQPPKPALGSGDTTADAVSLAMPPGVEPNSPVVARPAPPGQSVPGTVETQTAAPVPQPAADASLTQGAVAAPVQPAAVSGETPAAQEIAPAVAPGRATVRVTGTRPAGMLPSANLTTSAAVGSPAARSRLRKQPVVRDTDEVAPSDVQAAPPVSDSAAPARRSKSVAKPDTARKPAPPDTSG